MFSIIVAVLFVIKIYSNSVHSLPKYIGSHYGKEKKKLLKRVEDAKRKVIRYEEAIKFIRKCLLHNLNPNLLDSSCTEILRPDLKLQSISEET